MKAVVTDITAVKKENGKEEKVTLSLKLPVDLHNKLKQASILNKKQIGTMIEEWAEKYISTQDVTVSLATLMKHALVREKPEPGIRMKGLTVLVSLRYHNLLRLEALRRNCTIRNLLRTSIKEKMVYRAEGQRS